MTARPVTRRGFLKMGYAAVGGAVVARNWRWHEGYRHYIEATVFALPLMKVNERYLDGRGYGETPFGIDEGEKVDLGANSTWNSDRM